jgi:hypothetical protein
MTRWVLVLMILSSGCAGRLVDRCVANGGDPVRCTQAIWAQSQANRRFWVGDGQGVRYSRPVVAVPGSHPLGVMPGAWPGTFTANPLPGSSRRQTFTVVPLR